MRVPFPVWTQMKREALEAKMTMRDFATKILQEALVSPPCICDYNRCDEEPCYGNCGCVACRRAGE